MKNLFKATILLILLNSISFSQSLRQQLYNDILDGELNQFSDIEAAFIISGADSQSKLQQGLNWFNSLLQDIEEKNLIEFDKVASAEKLFLYFHTSILKKYREKATTLFDIKEKGEFNCVSATVLYNLTCDELGLSTHAFETPTHVYTIFSNFTDNVMVENTTSMGFNIMKNLKRYSQYLARYYPEKLTLKIGLDRLYYYENSKGREISNTELLGLICYNLAIFNAKLKNYAKAYSYVELAQLFNQDSRSNRKFEISLYYRWGKQLFNTSKYYQAFELMADAFYRYPENDDFKKNCRLMFTKALHQLWKNKDWEKTESIILEMDDLKIIGERETIYQKKVLNDWIRFFLGRDKSDQARRAVQLYDTFYK